jgi:phospholipid/cholesterol/gamma-HCH transport system substrate-binding protein
VRYLGVDVGRVKSLSVDRRDPGRVKVVAEVDTDAPLSGATLARLGLLGLTGLLFIDLQLDPQADANRPLDPGHEHPVIRSRKGDIEAFLESLPDLIGRVGGVLTRIETLLGDDNLTAITQSLANVREASDDLPRLSGNAADLATELRATSAEATALLQRLNGMAGDTQGELGATLASMRAASERLARTAESLERIVAGNEASLGGLAGEGAVEMQQLLFELREAGGEVRALARELRDSPSSLLREPKERGVEIEP